MAVHASWRDRRLEAFQFQAFDSCRHSKRYRIRMFRMFHSIQVVGFSAKVCSRTSASTEYGGSPASNLC